MRKHETNTGGTTSLTEEDGKELLAIARETVKCMLFEEPLPNLTTSNDRLLCHCGAFVSIHKRDELRGCIGYIESDKPLPETVSACAVQAAFHDYRFVPLTKDELSKLAFEISVLTPLELVEDTSKIVVGKHGLLISARGRSGLLLPQVATEYNWDRETFLQHTCLKAGLPVDEWKSSGAQIYRFEAQIFHDLL